MNTGEIFRIVEGVLGLTITYVSRAAVGFLFEGEEVEILRSTKEEHETEHWLVTNILSKIYNRGFYDGAQDYKQKFRELLEVE